MIILVGAVVLLISFLFLQGNTTHEIVDDPETQLSVSELNKLAGGEAASKETGESLKAVKGIETTEVERDVRQEAELETNSQLSVKEIDSSMREQRLQNDEPTKTRVTLTEEELLRVELTNEERALSKENKIDYRHESVFEREKDPNWSTQTEETIREGLINMPEEFNFFAQVNSIDCSDVICFISINPFDFEQFRKSQMSFIENVMAPAGLARSKAHRNVGEKSGIYAYRYYELLLPN